MVAFKVVISTFSIPKFGWKLTTGFQVDMAPKAMKKKKADTLRRKKKFPKPSGSVMDYTRHRCKDTVIKVTYNITIGRMC